MLSFFSVPPMVLVPATNLEYGHGLFVQWQKGKLQSDFYFSYSEPYTEKVINIKAPDMLVYNNSLVGPITNWNLDNLGKV